jgi:hypothetical protein
MRTIYKIAASFVIAVLACIFSFYVLGILEVPPSNLELLIQSTFVLAIIFSVIFGIVAKMEWKKVITYSILTALLAAFILPSIFFIGWWYIYQVAAPHEILISNTDSYEHSIAIELYSDGKLLLRKSYLLEPKSRVKSDLPKGLIFTSFPQHLHVTLDSKIEEMYDLRVHGRACVTIINESGTLSLFVEHMGAD